MKSLRLGRLDVEIANNRITMAGRLDDASPLAGLVDEVTAGEVAIDTAGITFINSHGVREWTRLLHALRQRGRVVLERVADVVMTQMNLIGKTEVTIRSFHAQYLCPKCGGEHAPLVEVEPHAQALRRMEAPPLPCPECGAAMELADFPERYLWIFKV